ncbi:MAG: DUF4351 domain-containing protein, partial [Turicibacter sp.]
NNANILKEMKEKEKLKGIALGESKVIIRQLTKRLGNLSETMINSIQGLSSNQLEQLEDDIFEFKTLKDLETMLTKLNS